MKTLSALLKHCANNGLTMVCYYDDSRDPDYRGASQRKAKEALEACDEMNLLILDAEGKRWDGRSSSTNSNRIRKSRSPTTPPTTGSTPG